MSALNKWKKKLGFKHNSCYDAAVVGDLEEIKKYKVWYDSLEAEDTNNKDKYPKYVIQLYDVYKGHGILEGAMDGRNVNLIKYMFDSLGKTPDFYTLHIIKEKLSVETLDFWLANSYPIDQRALIHYVFQCDEDIINTLIKYMKPSEEIWQTACICESSEIFKILISSIDKYQDHCLDSTCILIAATRSDQVGKEIFELACKHANRYTSRLVVDYNYFQHPKLHLYAQEKVLELIIEDPQRFQNKDSVVNVNTIIASLITRETFRNFVQQDNLKACEIIYKVYKDWYEPPVIIYETDGSYYRVSSELKEWLKTHELKHGSKLRF